MFGMSAFDAIKDGSVKDTLNFDELLDDGAEDTLCALEGALCGNECEGDCDCDDVDFEDEDDPENADDYFPGEPITEFDDDDDPAEEEDDDYDDIVDGTDADEFIEGIDDDDDPEEFEDDEIGDITAKKSKCKKCKQANESTFDDIFTYDDIATEGFKSAVTSTISTIGELDTVLSSISGIVGLAAGLGISVVDMAIASVFEKVLYADGIKQLRDMAKKTDDKEKKAKLLDRATRAEHIRDIMSGIQRKTPLDESLNKPNIIDKVVGWFQDVTGEMRDMYKGHLEKASKKNEAKGNTALATRQKAALAYHNAMTVESAFDDLFTYDDIATEGSAFEPKMDPNSFDSTYFNDNLDIESDSVDELVLFDDDEDDEDEDDMGIELGLEGVGTAIAATALYTGAFAVGTALGVGTVMGIEKIASAINDKSLAKKGNEMRTPTEDELREFYSASLKAASAAAKSASSIIQDYNLKQNSIKYYEPKEKDIIKKMRTCKGALGIVIANIYAPNGASYSKTTQRNYVAALEELKKKIAAAVPAGIETYVDGTCIFIFKVLN